MRRWNSFSELIYFPLEVLYIASIILGMTGILFNPNFQIFFSINHPFLRSIIDMLRYLSSFFIQNFPLIFLLRAVHRRNEDGMVIIAAFLAYLAFHVGIMFFAPSNLAPETYSAVLGLRASASALATRDMGILMPFHTGIIGALIVMFITRTVARQLKTRSPYSLFSFVDKNVSIIMGSVFYALIAGVGIAYIWPYLINFLQAVFSFIARDLNNPINLFIYGGLDRVMNIFNFSDWMHQLFWFTSMGGNWVDPLGAVFNGDVSMWTAQLAQNISGFTSGKLITPYYILNIFAVPAFILAAYQTYTDRLVRRRLLGFVIASIVFSILFGTLLPIEVFLLFTAPLLFLFHLMFTALLFAILPTFDIIIGYRFTGAISVATPGSIIDLLVLIRNPFYQRALAILLFIGLMTFLLYYAVTSYYYHKGAISIINPNEKELVISELLDSLGQVGNIKMINASIGKIIVQVHERERVDFSKIHHRATKIVETRAGYAISYGASSYMLYEIISNLKQDSLVLNEGK